jgi:uncharacterized protein YjaZ
MKVKQIIFNNNLVVSICFFIDFNTEEILQEMMRILKKCVRYLSIESNLCIGIKPTSDIFIKEKLQGVAGYTSCKDSILISFYPGTKNWKKILPITLTHEYNHALTYHYYPSPNNKEFKLLHGIISEGIADNFTEDVIGRTAPWVVKNSLRKYKKYFPKIKTMLNNSNLDVYDEVFLGTGKYPLWIGYLIGYWIVRTFLDKNPRKKWEAIIKLSPYEIFKESGLNL